MTSPNIAGELRRYTGIDFAIIEHAITPLTVALKDALVGDRVLIDLTTGSYTILATDGATNGCVIMPLDISKYPGKVRFAFRNGVSYLA